MQYQSNIPYPTPKVQKPNKEYAEMLSCAYAGAISELTAANQYMYQSFILDQQLSNVLKKIGIVEMHHIELLAETINLLGLEPRYGVYRDNQFVYWNSETVPYNTDIPTILKIDIESETMAIQNYEKLIIAIQDPYIQELIKRIILDEQIHLQIFNNLLLQYT